jgi:hypothetical protein
MKSDNVKLSFECHENWNNFQQVPGGRLCGTCQHIVHDFTNSTPEKVSEALKKNPGGICGRFRVSQPKSNFIKRAAMVTASVALAACAPDITPVVEQDIQQMPGDEYAMGYDTTLIADTIEYITMGIPIMPDSLIEKIDPKK